MNCDEVLKSGRREEYPDSERVCLVSCMAIAVMLLAIAVMLLRVCDSDKKAVVRPV